MPLNKVKPGSNMYQFLTDTWNPLGGECSHKCSYCSTEKLMRYPVLKKKYSGSTWFVEKEMQTNLKKDNFIFVCAQHDLFANNIPAEWIQDIIDKCKEHPENKYFFQTKNPSRFILFDLPPNSVICTTIETNRWYPEVMMNSPSPQDRVKCMKRIHDIKKYITIEPIMKFDLYMMISYIKRCNVEQVNVGADSCNKNLPEPSKEEVEELISRLSKFTTVVPKENLKRLLK